MRSTASKRFCLRARRALCVATVTGFSLTGIAQVADDSTVASAKGDAVVLQAFTITESKSQKYGASNLASATRMNTPIENVPQTISVMNSALLADIDAYSLDQALRYTPGATQRQNSPDGAVIRGLTPSALNHYVDGYAAPQLGSDLANIDRIELIKGPSASIAGASESTGFLNFITKKPLFNSQNSVDLTIGSWNSIRGVFDATGPVPGYENVAFRLIGSYMNANTFRDNEHIRKTAVYPSFLWRISHDTELLTQIESASNFTPGGFGTAYLAPTFGSTPTRIVVPANAKILLNRFMPLNQNSSGAAGMGRSTDINSLFLSFTHRFNDVFAFRQSGRLFEYNNDLYLNQLANNYTYDADGNLIGTYQTRRTFNKQQTYRFQGDLAITLHPFADRVSIRTLVGYDFARNELDTTVYASANGAIPYNFVNPIYDSGMPTNLPLAGIANTKGGSFAAFANTQIGFFQDRAIVTGGIRWDQNAASTTRNPQDGSVFSTPASSYIRSPMIGLTVKPTSWLALFGVYSDAGAASSIVSTYPGIPPTDSRQILVSATPDTTNREYGAKLTFFKGDLSLSVSHFDTFQNGFTRNQTDPAVPGGVQTFVEIGNHSKGIEVSWAGNVTRSLSVFGGYVFDETNAPGFKPDGSRLELRGTPRHKVQLFTRYEIRKTVSGSFGIKAGVVSQDSVYGNAPNTYKVPGATRYDVGIDYHNDRWSFSTGIINLTNVIFPTYLIGQGSNSIDDPRNFYFTVGYKF